MCLSKDLLFSSVNNSMDVFNRMVEGNFKKLEFELHEFHK